MNVSSLANGSSTAVQPGQTQYHKPTYSLLLKFSES